MLLEFRVANYRSFKDEAVFSLLASKDSSLSQNTVATGIAAIERVNRSAVIYGANASGKTNLVRALQLMRGVVVESAALQPSQQFNVQPFQLDEDSRVAPTLFEVTVLLDGVRHQYGFEFVANRIIAEWLLVYKAAKPQVWFDRRVGENGEVYKFGSNLPGRKSVWQEATRPKALFLSVAVQLNSEALSPLYNWFADSLIVLPIGGELLAEYTNKHVATPGGHSRIKSLLASADIGIDSISTERKKGVQHSFALDLATNKTDTKQDEIEIVVTKFKHAVGDVSAEFELSEESHGTQKLYALAGPLYEILEGGQVLVIDELDRSLHPLLVRQIIRMFNDPEVNPHGAQLIFTTHDTSQFDGTLLRRDQIWLTEKRADQSSELVPLSEFSPRKGEALEKGYLSGRYGGVPILAPGLLSWGANGKG